LQSPVERTFLQLLAKYPDSLLERKYGRKAALEVSRIAREIVEAKDGYSQWSMIAFDAWLRSGCAKPYSADPMHSMPPSLVAAAPNARNPGTTADLITASLFVALRRGIIQLPLPRPSVSE
jgi:triphosphoribosyl-dephospho-CoA synthetase